MIISAILLLTAFQGHPWTLACGGDIMLNGLSPSPKRLALAAEIFKRATVSIANLEVPLTDTRVPTIHKSAAEVKARTQFILRASPGHSKFLKDWGLQVLTEGNNHAMDYGGGGLTQMIALLDGCSIRHAGAGRNWQDAWTPADVPLPGIDDLRIAAALSFAGVEALRKCTPATKSKPGVATLLYSGTSKLPAQKKLERLVARLRSGSGPVVLFLHWGTERTPVPRAYQVTLGRACIDAGADAVIGAHPHVFQGAELYRGKPILYSLGNLIAPLPGDSGVAELRFDGRKFVSFHLNPLRNAGGVLVRFKSNDERRFLKEFGEKSDAIQRQFPNPDSVVLSSD